MIALKGIEVSNQIKEQVAAQLQERGGRPPKLAIVRVGERPDDLSYERGALKKMEAFGLRAEVYAYPQEIRMGEFREAFSAINADTQVQGILLLKPLPVQLDEAEIAGMIDPSKDLDGISPVNAAKVFSGDPSGFAPCTAQAVVETLKAYDIPIRGKRVVVVGRSMVVGRPLSMLLMKEDATVTICHTKTEDLPEVCREAQILVAAAGRARMIDRGYVGEGAVVIDVGIHVDEDGKLCGDVEYDSLDGIASMATPVPGGIGTVTTAVLAAHLMQASCRQQ